MSSKVRYMIDSVMRKVSIDFENEEDLIECYTEKSLEIAGSRCRKLALVETVYPEVLCAYCVNIIRPFNSELTIVTVPVEFVSVFKDFYKALNKKCVVSF